MNLPIWWGGWLFFLVPLILFVGCFLFVRRGESVSVKAIAFIAGNDNRLSLSRIQALAWSLVIYGSFVAAMAVHMPISPVSSAQKKEYDRVAEKAATQMPVLTDALNKAEADKKTSEQAKREADNNLRDAQNRLSVLKESNPAATPEVIADADKKLKEAQIESNTKARNLEQAQQLVKETESNVKAADEAKTKAFSLNWVEIPTALLALSGIAIGSGIFSSLISALNGEDKTACVTSIEKITSEEFGNKAVYPDTPPTTSNNLLRIRGKDMDNTGKVRFGIGTLMTKYAPILYWRSNGTEIIVDIQTDPSFNTLVVDTPNGKLSYDLTDRQKELERLSADYNAKNKVLVDTMAKVADLNLKDPNNATHSPQTEASQEIDAAKDLSDTKKETTNAISRAQQETDAAKRLLDAIQKETDKTSSLVLKESKHFYEFSDLFRDDKNPSSMDLMKFQMFGWTIIAIVTYSYLFLSNITNNLGSLPLVPDSIVILTGLSQTGYLAGKGVSNVKPNTSPATTSSTNQPTQI